MHDLLLGALSWNPQIKGGLYVLIAVLILPGSGYLLLATNLGARLGFLVALAGFTGFLVILGSVWWIYAIGPKGKEPVWRVKAVAVGDPADSSSDVLAGFPEDWEKLEPNDPEVADAQPVADGALTGSGAQFKSANEYVIVAAYTKGGERWGPLGLDLRPFNVFHKAHYLAVQVQPVLHQPAVPGQPAPRPAPDPSQPTVTAVMLRDLGAKRLNPGVATVSALLLFSLVCYQLHVRDKEGMAKRG